jgi:hypothetical protein
MPAAAPAAAAAAAKFCLLIVRAVRQRRSCSSRALGQLVALGTQLHGEQRHVVGVVARGGPEEVDGHHAEEVGSISVRAVREKDLDEPPARRPRRSVQRDLAGLVRHVDHQAVGQLPHERQERGLGVVALPAFLDPLMIPFGTDLGETNERVEQRPRPR